MKLFIGFFHEKKNQRTTKFKFSHIQRAASAIEVTYGYEVRLRRIIRSIIKIIYTLIVLVGPICSSRNINWKKSFIINCDFAGRFTITRFKILTNIGL
jgi:hypothetical protein